MKRLLTIGLITFSTTTLAGPTAFQDLGTEQTDDGRSFKKLGITCSNSDKPKAVVKYEATNKWCLEDGSYCNRDKIRAAKKACKRK